MKDEMLVREFVRLFRCTPEAAPTYIKRVHERMGYEVPIETIVAALHKISPKRLTMDALIDRLRKMERAPGRARKPALSEAEGAPAAGGGDPVGLPAGMRSRSEPPKPALRSLPRAKSKGPRPRAGRGGAGSTAEGPSATTYISMVLTRNWERGRKQGLKPLVMTTDRFVKTAQSIAGTPKPSVARVLRSVEKLDRMGVLLTPNLVADDIHESVDE